MKYRPSTVVIVLCASLGLLTGCGSDTSPGNATTASTSAAITSGPPDSGAPGVDDPLKTDSIDNTPCNAATAKQLESFGGKLKNSSTDPVLSKSKACGWVFEDGWGTITAGTILENSRGLSSLYSKQAKGQLTSFQPLPPIEGYPAVLYADGGRIGDGQCSLAVGLRNDRSYVVGTDLGLQNSHYANPCELATKLAEFAIQYLKGRQ